MADRSEETVDAATSGARLSLALLTYFVIVTLVITLSPFDFGPRPLRLSLVMKPTDIAANIVLFLPLGFLMRSLDARLMQRGLGPVWTAMALSILIESAQIFIRGRFVSPVDVTTNTLGAYLGLVLRDRIERWAMWHPRAVGRAGLDIPLVGLLYLLVPQLWLSSVGLIDDPRRSLTTLLLGCAGSIVLVSLQRHRWKGGVRLAARVVPPLAVLWFVIGVLPALAASPRIFVTMALSVLGLTWWLLRHDRTTSERRFEVDTLRRFFPVFTTYLVIAALWPPMRAVVPWHGAVGFLDRLNNVSVVDLLVLLEQVGAFTLLGYAAAEWRGRQELSLRSDMSVLLLGAGAAAAALELVQGILSGPGASLLRALLSTSGALYGVAVYHLARTHVRTLRASVIGDEPDAVAAPGDGRRMLPTELPPAA